MILKKKIPNEFYKLFRTKNQDAYMQFVAAVYEENNQVYASLGLTYEECCFIIETTMEKAAITWEEDDETEELFFGSSSSGILNRLIKWGWLKSDFDEKLNTSVISFPEYSQLFAELFLKLQSDTNSRERESILSIYSALFTYHSDTEKNNDILKNAWNSSKNLGQLLSNMQDGMRAYFDELSSKKNFIGIQQVLIEEINNQDSKKYAILTTKDSFYRYKEAVKELISSILNENELKKDELFFEGMEFAPDSLEKKRNERQLEYCQTAIELVCEIEREFDMIERKYNKLIEQKTIFAKRALARIHYILQEGADEDESIMKLIGLLDCSENKEHILEELRQSIKVTTQFRNISDSSFANRRGHNETEFEPIVLEEKKESLEWNITDFVPKPLYTKKQLRKFYKENSVNGVFTATEETVKDAEDLEKLFFLWQEETKEFCKDDKIQIDGEIKGQNGFSYSKLIIGHEKENGM